MNSYENLITRSSTRNFSDKPVSNDIIKKIVYAGHRAANANNKQKRLDIKNMCPNGPYIECAPVCVCVFCEESNFYIEDGSAATQNILNAAHFLGLGGCPRIAFS